MARPGFSAVGHQGGVASPEGEMVWVVVLSDPCTIHHVA